MPLINIIKYNELIAFCNQTNTTLIAVSKTKPIEAIEALYKLGQRDFGENYVQELVAKQAALPKDIRWHFIGHLQTNKVKYIAPFVHIIHGVDSIKLYTEIAKQATKLNKKINCLLQAHIATESTKFGFNVAELNAENINNFAQPFAPIMGFMGMASFSQNEAQIANEFSSLKNCFNTTKTAMPAVTTLSMGMSGDYKLAVAHGSNMIRVGSLLFGKR